MSHSSPQARFNSTTKTLTQIFICFYQDLLCFLCQNVSYDVAKAADTEAPM